MLDPFHCLCIVFNKYDYTPTGLILSVSLTNTFSVRQKEKGVIGYSHWHCTEKEKREGSGEISLSERRSKTVGEETRRDLCPDETEGL